MHPPPRPRPLPSLIYNIRVRQPKHQGLPYQVHQQDFNEALKERIQDVATHHDGRSIWVSVVNQTAVQRRISAFTIHFYFDVCHPSSIELAFSDRPSVLQDTNPIFIAFELDKDAFAFRFCDPPLISFLNGHLPPDKLEKELLLLQLLLPAKVLWQAIYF